MPFVELTFVVNRRDGNHLVGAVANAADDTIEEKREKTRKMATARLRRLVERSERMLRVCPSSS